MEIFYLFSFKDWTQSLESASWLMHLSCNHSDIESSAGICYKKKSQDEAHTLSLVTNQKGIWFNIIAVSMK